MGLFSYYLRVFIRSNFKPVGKNIAKRWHNTTSIMYFLLAWTTFGYTVYVFSKNYEKNEKDPAYRGAMVIDPYEYMKKFGTKPEFTVLNVTGTSVEKEVYTLDELEKKIEERKQKIN